MANIENQLIFDGGNEVITDGGGGGNVIVDGGDISGGNTTNNTAQAAAQIEEFASEGGGVLAIAYGEHLIAGHLIVHKFTAGSPNTSIVYVALGDGAGNGGGHGEWEGAVAVYYAGASQSVSPDGSTAGYRFHNGFISTAVDSGNQQVDAFLTGGLAYSGTAYIAVKLTDAVANAEDRPDKLRGRYKGRRTNDFDKSGNFGSYAYFINPANIATDRVLAYYDHKFPNSFQQARDKLQAKIDWDAWNAWKDFNAADISWDNGTSVISINRFDCNIVFTADAILADALDQICATAGAWWQDDGEQIIFLPPTDRDPVHHFDESNIVGAPSVQPRDLRERPNYFVIEFRDFNDPFLGLSSTEVRRDALIAQAGEIKTVRAMPPMRKSQADRLAERMARLEADNPNIISLVADESSIHAAPGDFVTLSHPIGNYEYQRCLVLSVTISSAEAGITCEFVLQQVDDALYSDTAHGPRQEALTP